MDDQSPFELPLADKVKFEESAKKQGNIIHKYYLRKPQKECFECSARCCDASYTTRKDFDDCVELCFVKFYDKKDYVESEFEVYASGFNECVEKCAVKGKEMMDSPEVANATTVFYKCIQDCQQEYALLLHKTVEKIIETLTTKF